MSKINKKADPLFYEKVGKFIELWLKDNKAKRIRPGSNKELAAFLKRTPSQVSRWIHGINQMPATIILHLNQMHGFNSKHYDEYLAQKNNISLDHLTKEDLFRLIREMQIAHDRDNELLLKFFDSSTKLHEEHYHLVRQSRTLIDEVEKLRKENRTLKKQLKIEE